MCKPFGAVLVTSSPFKAELVAPLKKEKMKENVRGRGRGTTKKLVKRNLCQDPEPSCSDQPIQTKNR